MTNFAMCENAVRILNTRAIGLDTVGFALDSVCHGDDDGVINHEIGIFIEFKA